MYQDLLNQTNTQLAQLSATAEQFNRVAVEHADKLARFQLAAARGYARLRLQNLQSEMDAAKAHDLQQFVSRQKQLAETAGQQLQADLGTLSRLNQGFMADLQKLARGSLTAAQENARGTARKTSIKHA